MLTPASNLRAFVQHWNGTSWSTVKALGRHNQCGQVVDRHCNAQLGQDSGGNLGDVSSMMRTLVGDTNGNSAVNSTDVAETKSRLGQQVTIDNFRSDVNANGTINASGVAIAKSNVGSGLP